jgi:hypothetical protein
MKLCKDCKYYTTLNTSTIPRCGRVVDLVTGDKIALCSSERIGGWLESRVWDVCGASGRFWKPKDVK